MPDCFTCACHCVSAFWLQVEPAPVTATNTAACATVACRTVPAISPTARTPAAARRQRVAPTGAGIGTLNMTYLAMTGLLGLGIGDDRDGAFPLPGDEPGLVGA